MLFLPKKPFPLTRKHVVLLAGVFLFVIALFAGLVMLGRELAENDFQPTWRQQPESTHLDQPVGGFYCRHAWRDCDSDGVYHGYSFCRSSDGDVLFWIVRYQPNRLSATVYFKGMSETFVFTDRVESLTWAETRILEKSSQLADPPPSLPEQVAQAVAP